MKKFLVKFLLFSSPIFALTITYIATDVFKVIYHYDPFYTEGQIINLNRAYGSTETYLNQDPKYNYDSFIFGNSRSLFYEVDTWKKYLPEGSVCIHYDESHGSICGLRDKVVFIDNHGGRLNNALLVIDHNLLSEYDQLKGHLFITPPILKDNSNFFNFHVQHFGAFMNPMFLTSLVDYKLFGKNRFIETDYIFPTASIYIPEYNEWQKKKDEEKIANGTYYDAAHISTFEGIQEPGTYSHEILGEKEINCFREMKAVFDKHKTSYKFVVSPLYDQIKLNRDTYNTLCAIFGKDHVYDFSGVNKWNKDYHNYYEYSHYRPNVAAEIMDIIYSK